MKKKYDWWLTVRVIWHSLVTVAVYIAATTVDKGIDYVG